MATAIGFFAGEGSNPAQLSEVENKELVVVYVDDGADYASIMSDLAQKFCTQRFPTANIQGDSEEFAEMRTWMVLVSVINSDGEVTSGEQVEADHNE